jgi:membrane-associated phospholipid phosphatase
MSDSFFSKYRVIGLLILAFLCPNPAVADELLSATTMTAPQLGEQQNSSPVSGVEFNKEYFSGYLTDGKAIITAPMRWESSDWITAGFITGVASVLYENDAKIQKWVLDHKTTTTDNTGDTVTDFGHGKFTPAILGGMYLYGHFADDGKMRETVLLSVESFVLTGVFVQTLKYAANRHRPFTGDGSRAWDGPRLNTPYDSHSFPSGHATAAFAVASVIASEYDNMFVPPLAYSVAVITALNRVSHDAHWSSDVFVSWAIGYFTGKAIVASHRNSTEGNVMITPAIIDGAPGMTLTYRF